ncbi:MAG: hypothetical protein HC890_05615 [Chloroflexaceae bacterium]|nr:hypothetical protein [Chloroflexaceae bacterium]
MSSRRKQSTFFSRLFRQLFRFARNFYRGLQHWLLRRLYQLKKTNQLGTGFVLPIATLIIVLVTLLVATLLSRSFDRADTASNFRASQVSFDAAAPAVDRAKAKLDQLFSDARLPRRTPGDQALIPIFDDDFYTLPDETRLRLAFDIDGNSNIEDGAGVLQNNERITSAWRFPVDTDNNGAFDTFVLYTILFRTPPIAAGVPARQRVPLEARTLPQSTNFDSDACPTGNGTIAQVVGGEGWFQVDGLLRKSFFTYAAAVPITDATGLGANFEVFSSNNSFTAIEFQQDREQIPINNNAIVYENDLELFPGPPFVVNGRIFTNANFNTLVSGGLTFRLISSPNSCFYNEENSKIVVGGNHIVGQGETLATNQNHAVDLLMVMALLRFLALLIIS